jgi:hypothetical protein
MRYQGEPAFIGHGNFAVEHDLVPAGQQIAKWRVEERSVIVPADELQPRPTRPTPRAIR